MFNRAGATVMQRNKVDKAFIIAVSLFPGQRKGLTTFILCGKLLCCCVYELKHFMGSCMLWGLKNQINIFSFGHLLE